MTKKNLSWYVLRTRGQFEKKLATYFDKVGMEYYLPLVTRKRNWSDRVKYIDFPLFPGYIFLRFDWSSEFALAVSHPGAVGFIMHIGKAEVMQDKDIENLKLFVEQAKEIYNDPYGNFPQGQEVMVRSGPFEGVYGTVLRVKNKERIYVQLPLLNQVVSAELGVMDVAKIR